MTEAPPPEEADTWTDEQWIEWLEATDATAGDRQFRPLAPRRPRSVGAQMLASVMLGFHEMFYGRRDEQVEIAPARDPDPEDDEIQLHLDPDDPAKSEIRLKNGE
ncbi:MAG TPA: hypothetical protein VMY88_04410 [Acidimicrobiales bacterium]|nr:hypothetical protein [Acidimicrobiales bacterium]